MKVPARIFLLHCRVTCLFCTACLSRLIVNKRPESAVINRRVNLRCHCILGHHFIRQNINYWSRIFADVIHHYAFQNSCSSSNLISLHNVNTSCRTVRRKLIHNLPKIRKLVITEFARKRRQSSVYIAHLLNIFSWLYIASFCRNLREIFNQKINVTFSNNLSHFSHCHTFRFYSPHQFLQYHG